MTDDDNQESTDSIDEVESLQLAAASSTFKVRGEFSDSSGTGVLGRNTANNGTPIGVEGAVPNADGFGLSTPHDTRVGGTMATSGTWEVTVDGNTAQSLTAGETFTTGGVTLEGGNTVAGNRNQTTSGVVGAVIGGGGLYNQSQPTSLGNTVTDHASTVGGGSNNTAGDGDSDLLSAFAATVGGGQGNTARGQESTIGGGRDNTASGDGATVGGGNTNPASGGDATVGGGGGNTASGSHATVGGGLENTAAGDRSTAPGGRNNSASGNYTFVAGRKAKAPNDGSFVWSDSNDTTFSSTQADQFLVDAGGGVGIGTDNPSGALDVAGDVTASSDVTVSNNATVSGDLDVGGTIKRNAMTQVYLGTASTVSNDTETAVPFDTTDPDEPGAWSGTNNEYTCPQNGHYEISFNVKFASDFSSESSVTPRVRVNGSSSYSWFTEAFAGESFERSFTTTLTDLVAGDTIDFTVQQQSGGDKDLPFGSQGIRATIRYLGDGS